MHVCPIAGVGVRVCVPGVGGGGGGGGLISATWAATGHFV